MATTLYTLNSTGRRRFAEFQRRLALRARVRWS